MTNKLYQQGIKLCKILIFASTLMVSCSLTLAATTEAEQKPAALNKPETALKRYINNTTTTKRITLNFTNIPTRELLQLFAQFTGTNFIISNKVAGNMSIHLKNIPWNQALTAILKSQGLAQRRLGETVIIAPAADIQQEQLQELKQAQEISKFKTNATISSLESITKIQGLQPLSNKIIILNYAKAEDIANMLTKEGSLLTSRGSLGFDPRSNSIWIRDTASHIATIMRLIKKLDFPEKQVVIEARIVSISRPFERQLGIRWGLSSTANKLSGTLAGANSNLTTPLDQVSLPTRLNFNFAGSATSAPVLQASSTPIASLGIALAKLGNFNVDLELSALEEEGKIQLVSKPRLVTSNLQEASIETGQEIPYQESTSSGATSISFKNASLSLKVTPRITADNRVLLSITVTNNRAGTVVPLAGGGSAIPIDTEQESSTILVNDRQTIVLGGVYRQDKRKIVTRIPFLGRIPIIGYLFKYTQIRNNRDELLIFLTPRIIHTPSDLNKE